MPIVKNKKKNNFTAINNKTLGDKSLSWKAKGLLAYLLSLPPNWEIYLSEIKKHATDGKTSFRSGIKELREAGYVNYEKKKDDEGKFKHEYTVYETPNHNPENPAPENPDMDNSDMDNPDMDNQKLLSTNKLKTNELNTDLNNTKRKGKNSSSPLTEKEKKILNILKSVNLYPFDYENDLEHIRELKTDYPDIDLLEEVKKWRTYKRDKPLKENSNARLQLRNWMKNASEWQKDNNGGGRREVADF